jgi:GNAT superfamily N-acetyltransferase
MNDGCPAPLQWRPMSAADLAAVDDLSARIHPDFPERPEVLAEKFRLFPRGCFVLAAAPEGRPNGYCFSHPWMFGAPPALDTMLRALPEAATAYFIHDLTVEASLRGRNFASTLVPRLFEAARDAALRRMMLVAVSGSTPFWMRMGFHRTGDDQLQAATRAKYGDGAVHMNRDLA